MSKLRVRCNIPNDVDATAFYRSTGPLRAMERQWDDYTFTFNNPTYNWASLCNDDIMFLQRPYRQDHLDLVKMAKNNGKKVLVDYDDDLFTVPVSNPAHHIYGKKDTQTIIAKIIAHADAVTVSTPALQEAFQNRNGHCLNKNVTVVPNAYNEFILNHIAKQTPIDPVRQKLVMWRGSPTHQKDLSTYLPEIVETVNANKDWTFIFQGDRPWFLFERLNDNAIFGPAIDPIEYFQMIRKTQPALFIVPLEDCEFNRSKSNIAWIEATFAGAVTLAPDWPEWKRPGVLNYSSPETFKTILQAFINGSYDMGPLVSQSWEYIMDNLKVSKVNEIRRNVLEQLRD